MIPPAGGYPPFTKFLKQQFLLSKANFCLEKLFEQEVLLSTSSGKSALYSVFLALRKLHAAKKILIPSYSCPDILIAAVKAGYKVELAPLSPRTLQVDKDFLLSLNKSEFAAVVFANLYGMPDEIPAGIDPGILIIDDLCQSLLSKKQRRVGISVFSSGRGKSLCGLGGGGLILKKGDEFSEQVFEFAKTEVDTWSKLNIHKELKVLLMSMLVPTLERPVFYSLLNTLAPFLKLGEVVINFDFDCEKISKLESAYAAYQYGDSTSCSQNPWPTKLKSLNLIQPYLEREFLEPVHLIRYPVLLASQELRDKAVLGLKSLGLSASYGKSLMEFEELKSYISYSNQVKPILGLMTLPVHKNVNQAVVDKVFNALIKLQEENR